MNGRMTVADDRAAPIDFDQLYATHWRSMLRLAQSLVDDVASAEDVVQEAFAAVFRRGPALNDPAAAGRYLHSCVVNGARSALRRRRTVRSRLFLLADHRDVPAADHQALLSAEHASVRATLSSLPQRQREVLALRLLADLDDVEIARILDTSHGNVRSAASRGLATLRAALMNSNADRQTGQEQS